MKFVNYKDGKLSINTYRLPDAIVTVFDDVIYAAEHQTDEILTASIESESQLKVAQECENDLVFIELSNYVADLAKRDETLKNAVFWELVYDEVSTQIENDFVKMFLINKFMIDLNMGGLRIIKDSTKPYNEGDYYTITGAQFIIGVKVPELPVNGLVTKTIVNTGKDGVAISERMNLIANFCKAKSFDKNRVIEFTKYLKKKLKVEDYAKLVLSEDAIKQAEDYVLREEICFQAKWNGIEAVKNLLNKEYEND